ncbi:protein Wnt-6, partial [Biomphalaria glabrata]
AATDFGIPCLSPLITDLRAFYHFFQFHLLFRAVGSPLVMDSNSICKKTKRLAGRQKTICKREPEVVAEVAKGAKLALMECKFQFRNRQWNCTTAKRSITQILNK